MHGDASRQTQFRTGLQQRSSYHGCKRTRRRIMFSRRLVIVENVKKNYHSLDVDCNQCRDKALSAFFVVAYLPVFRLAYSWSNCYNVSMFIDSFRVFTRLGCHPSFNLPSDLAFAMRQIHLTSSSLASQSSTTVRPCRWQMTNFHIQPGMLLLPSFAITG